MRVWSDLLREYFTVEEVKFNGEMVTLREGVFAMCGSTSALIKVAE